MVHWKTTTAGILTILAGLTKAGLEYLHNQPIDYTTLWASITAGIGLIKAADAPAAK